MVLYIIQKIIEKTEKSTVDWLENAAGNRSFSLKEYHEKDYKRISRSDFAKGVRELELSGLLQCRWYERYSEVSEIKYSLKDLSTFYKLAGRREKYIRINLLANYVKERLEKTGKLWIREVLKDMLIKLSEGKIPADLKAVDTNLQDILYSVDNWTENAKNCGQLDIFLILGGLDELKEPIYKQIFSSRCLKDRITDKKVTKASKVFKNHCQSQIISLARIYHPDVEEDMDETQILSQLYIEEYAQELAVKGPLIIELDGRELNLASFIYGTVLNSQTLNQASPASHQTIKTVITVENKANYEVMPYEEETLIIYCHGYFTPREREFLRKLYRNLKNKNVRYFHSGDLDYGGICIFKYIRTKIFPQLQPLFMDEAQYERYQEQAEPMEPETLIKLKKIEEPLLKPLINRLLEDGKTIEQENFVEDYRRLKIGDLW